LRKILPASNTLTKYKSQFYTTTTRHVRNLTLSTANSERWCVHTRLLHHKGIKTIRQYNSRSKNEVG